LGDGETEARMAATSQTCERDGTTTALTCVKCDAPICPKCLVRTEVGLRCPKCAAGRGRRLRSDRRWIVVVGAVALVALVGFLILRASARKVGPASTNDAAGTISGYRKVTPPGIGYSLDVPAAWTPASDNTGTTTSYAASPPTLGSVRVSVGFDSSALAVHVAGLIQALQKQGGVDFVQKPTTITGLEAIRLDYRFPATANIGSPLISHISYLVHRDSASVVSFQLATNNPNAEATIFDHIESSLAILDFGATRPPAP
jgi:hypothetical protein